MKTITIIGHLIEDAKVGQTKGGTPVAKFTLKWAYGSETKSGQTPRSSFFPVELYGGERINDWLKAGKTVAVTGHIRTGSFKGKDGKTRYTKVLVVDPSGFSFASDGMDMSSAVVTGRLLADAKTFYLDKSQLSIVEFILAVDNGKDRDPDFYPIKAFGPKAEAAARYLTKGTEVAIKGRVETGSYKKADGSTEYTWNIIPSNDEDSLRRVEPRKKRDAAETADEPTAAEPAEPSMDDIDLGGTGFVDLPDDFPDDFDGDYFGDI